MPPKPQINDLALASVSYFPFLGLFLLLFRKIRTDYYLRYHVIHGIGLSAFTSLIFLTFVTCMSLFQSIFTYQLMLIIISALFITFSIIFLTGYHFFCAYQAYNSQYTVIPVVTKLYYLFFDKQN